MSIDCFWILVARKMSGESSFEETSQLEELLQTHPDLYFPFEIIANLWNQQGKINPDSLAYYYSGHIERMKNLGISMQQDASGDDGEFTYIFHGSRKNGFRGNLGIGFFPASGCQGHEAYREFYERNN